MLLKDLLKGITDYDKDTEISWLTSDSRKVTNGCAFVCIKGPVSDGHDYAATAKENGAKVIFTERDLGFDNQIILENTRTAFPIMCANWFGNPAKKLRIVGVTGTNGKTSTTYMLKKILEFAGEKVGVIGTIDNLIGDKKVEASNTTPGPFDMHKLFKDMVDDGCTYCVMEVSSHALDQDRVYGIEFTCAAFTNLTQDHLDYHKTMENYMLAKKKLFSMCKTAVFNMDDEWYEKLSEGLNCKLITYSEHSNSAYIAKDINIKPAGCEYELVGYGLISKIRLKIGGVFTVYNSLCAAVCALELGYSLTTVTAALASLEGVKGRAEAVDVGNRGFHIIIDYAHTPDGLENILSTFENMHKNRLVALFGCGGDRDKTKRPKMGKIASEHSDFCIVTSDNPRSEDPNMIIEDILEGMKNTKTPYIVIPNRIEAIKYAVKNAQKDDIIVFAGKGHETYQILNTGKIHLDEREVIAEALKEL